MIRSNPHRRQSSAFTLVELMISIALVLLLVIGINQVFHLTSQTVGTGQASSAAQRDMRAASKVMHDDFSNALTSDGPCFIIYSRRVWAFRNKQDQLADRDHNFATLDVQNTGVETTLPTPIYNNRNHRVDLVKFFARGEYHRQTGDPGSLVSTTSSNEAFITLGHAAVADNSAASLQPNDNGTGTSTAYNAFNYRDPADLLSTLYGFPNPNNQYSSQFILAREAMVLKPLAAGATDVVFSHNVSGTSPPDLSPVAAVVAPNNTVRDATGATRTVLEETPPTSSQAKVNVTITQTWQEATAFYKTPYIGTRANRYPVQSARVDQGNSTIAELSSDFAQRIRFYQGSGQPVWYRYFNPAGGLVSNTDLLYRIQCNPFITRSPGFGITSFGISQTTPQFVTGCSQFIVEFAGDFVKQDNNPASLTYGQVLSNQPDGVTDFIIPKTPPTYVNAVGQTYNNGARFPGEGIRQVRWYGLPRDTDGDGVINGFITGRNSNEMPDVVPVRDVMLTAPGATLASVAAAAPFEKEATPASKPNQDMTGVSQVVLGVPLMTSGGDYAGNVSPNNTYGDAFTDSQLPDDTSYLCIWNFGGPQMIRIVVTVDDPNGRLPDGQTFEYVFSLKK